MTKKRKLKKNVKYILIGAIAVIVGCFIFIRIKNQSVLSNMSITFIEDHVVEYGETIDANVFIQSIEGAQLKEVPEVDTMTLGEQEIKYVLENDGKTKEVKHKVMVEDTAPAQIVLKEDTIYLELNTVFSLESNIESISDPIDKELKFSAEKTEEKGMYYIEHDVDVQTEGTYTVTIYAIDKNGNTSNASYQVVVTKQAGNDSPSQGEGNEITPTYVNGILLVNKNHPLPRSYGGNDAEADAALYELQAGASLAGYAMPLLSGYRSYDYQAQLYDSYVARDGQQAADRYSAKPGKSEHQTGLAFDVGQLDNNFGNTDAGRWLAQNCAEYGFIIRFLEGKESITGYMYEPWHIRYVGVKAAKEIMAQGITLEEYLGVY